MIAISILALLFALYAAWASEQNTKAIHAVMKIIDEYEKMILEVLKK
jgi:hypothetical protein